MSTAQMNDSYCERLGDFFTIFAHVTRMRMLCALQNGPQTVTDIAAKAQISITNASQHLRLMRDKGAVVSEKHGQSVYYGIADQRFLRAVTLIRDALVEKIQGEARATNPPTMLRAAGSVPKKHESQNQRRNSA